MRWKWFFGIFAILLSAGILAGYALLSTYDFNQLKPSLQEAVASATGRNLEIGGDIHCKIGLTPTIVIGEVRFQNATWGSKPWMVEAKQLRLRVALLPLLHRIIRVRELTVVEPEVLLERNSSGIFNTALLQRRDESFGHDERSDSLAAAIITMLAFDGVRLEKGRLYIKNGPSGTHEVAVDLLEARASSATSPIFLTLRGSYRKVPFDLSGTLAPMATLLDAHIPHPVEVSGHIKDVELKVKGIVKDIWSARGVHLTFTAKGSAGATLLQLADLRQVHEPGPFEMSVTASDSEGHWSIHHLRFQAGSRELARLELAGSVADPAGRRGFDLTFRAHGNNLKKLGALLGKKLPVNGPFDLSGRIRDKGRKIYQLSSLDAAIRKNRMRGDLLVDLSGERAAFTGSLSAGALDLRPYLSGHKERASTAKETSKKVFPSSPLPWETFKRVNLDLAFQADTLMVPRLTIGSVGAHIGLHNGHLTLQDFQSLLAGGSFEGELDVRPGEHAPAVKAFLTVKHMNLRQLLQQVGVTYALDGNMDMDIAVIGSGRSVAEILAGLDGEIAISMGEGLIDNEYLNYLGAEVATTLLRIFNPLKNENHTTHIRCFVGRFEIEEGLATSTALVMDTAETVVVGDGQVDLETEELDLALKSTVKRGVGVDGVGKLSLNLGQLTRPLKLTGTLSDPDVVVDPAQTALLLGKALGGITVFGPFGIAAVLVSGSFGGKNPCLAAIEAAEKKKHDRESGTDPKEERTRDLADDVGGTLYWQNER